MTVPRPRLPNTRLTVIDAIALVDGTTAGDVIALAEPLSFWGGFDAVTGCVIDRRHPNHGQCLTGRVVVMRAARGSSSGSSVLAEAIRAATAPAGFILAARDPILTVGCQVAVELYGRACPIVVVGPTDLSRLSTIRHVSIAATNGRGRITWTDPPDSG